MMRWLFLALVLALTRGGAEEVQAPAPSKKLAIAVLEELRMLDAAKDQAAIELRLKAGAFIPAATLRTFLPDKSRLSVALINPEGPRDLLGNRYENVFIFSD